MHLAVAYYPEHCDESRWARDIALMVEHGIDTVRILEFAWSRMERGDARWDFSWLHRLLAQLVDANIGVVLCTPSAAPPAWLTKTHPECLCMDRQGHRAAHGHRRHYCPTSQLYRDYCTRIAGKMQQELGGYPNIRAWHIDNEFGWNLCFCPECDTAFRATMQQKYGTLEGLNAAWGGAFWSTDAWDWQEVELPRVGQPTPGAELALRQFYSDTITAFMSTQIHALRAAGCTAPISTNMMGDFNEIDYWKMAEPLDFVGWDNYFDIYTLAGNSLAHHLMRSLKGGKAYWTFENGVNSVGPWLQTPPGYNIVHALSALAHGEEGHTFFRWDSCPFGQEQDLQGLVDWAGMPRAKLTEVKALRNILDDLAQIDLPPLQPKVAIVYSWQNYWTTSSYLEQGYWTELEAYYQALFDLGIACDCVSPAGDFSRYDLLLTPGLCLVRDEELANLRSYVADGGVLLSGRKTLTKDPHNNYRRAAHPALPDVFGMRVVESQDNSESNDITTRSFLQPMTKRQFALTGHDGLPDSTSSGWVEVLELAGARPLYTYADGLFAERPVASAHAFRSGWALYLGTMLDRPAMRALLGQALRLAKIDEAVAVPQGVQLVRRGDLYLLTNHTGDPVTVSLPGGAVALAGAPFVAESVTLPPYGFSIVRGHPAANATR